MPSPLWLTVKSDSARSAIEIAIGCPPPSRAFLGATEAESKGTKTKGEPFGPGCPGPPASRVVPPERVVAVVAARSPCLDAALVHHEGHDRHHDRGAEGLEVEP